MTVNILVSYSLLLQEENEYSGFLRLRLFFIELFIGMAIGRSGISEVIAGTSSRSRPIQKVHADNKNGDG